MKKSTKVCLLFLIPIFVVWLFTGGFLVFKNKRFQASGNVFEKADLRISLRIDYKRFYSGIPFLFSYHVEKEPYKIYLLIRDESNVISGIEIGYLKISCVNGKTIELNLDKYYKVPVVMWPNPDDGYKISLPVKMLSVYFEDEKGKIELFDHVNMDVKVSGTVIMEDGTRDEFLIDANFEAEIIKGIGTYRML